MAPSPTGFLHVGTARTALFNYLFAKKYGGDFVLRIEDTDLERSDPLYEKSIFEGLNWLGISADESPEKGGSFAPYRQSQRSAAYTARAEMLLSQGKAFYCFHSASELEQEKQMLMEAKRPPLHLCEYRTLDPKEAELLKDIKTDYIIRFKTPAGKKIVFYDLIRGELSFDSDLLGDFSIAKKVDVPLYNFAVVVDDFEMRITHVIRGEDHIANTPKQLLLIEALEFFIPHYAHLPMILGSDRSKLSKRHGATSLIEYQKMGYLPEALFNFLALVGWNPGTEKEIFTKEELIGAFSLERIQKSGAIFDFTKLDWMNGEYIRALSPKELLKRAKDFLPEGARGYSESYLRDVLTLEQSRLKRLSEIEERSDYFFKTPEYDKDLLKWKQMTPEETSASLNRAEKVIARLAENTSKEAIEKTFLDEIGIGDKGSLLWPLRVALSGKKASPGPFEIIAILGAKEAQKRVKHAQEKILKS